MALLIFLKFFPLIACRFDRGMLSWVAVPGCSARGTVSYTHLDVYKRQRVDGAQLEGAHIADALLNRLVLFAAAPAGAAASGTLSYTYRPTTDTLTLLVNLPAGQRYTLATGAAGGQRSVTLTPNSSCVLAANAAGALTFLLRFDGAVAAPAQRLYLPRVSSGR